MNAAAEAPSRPAHLFLANGGEMGRLVASHDWAGTSLGPIDSWPQSLKTAAGIVLSSAVPIVMLWGPDGIMLYNDGYAVFAAGRHPQCLGGKVREAWPEVADFNDHVMKIGLAGRTLAYRDQELTLFRRGHPERVWMDLDYSPVLDEAGNPAGVIAIVVETTARILAERERDAAEARAIGVLEGMGEGFILLDAGFRVLAINAEGLRMEQRPREAILGLTQWEAWPGTEHSPLGDVYRRAMAERITASHEHRYVWPDGSAAWLEVRAYPSGEGLALFYRDITERRLAEDRKTALVGLGDRLRGLRHPSGIARAAGAAIGEALGCAQAAYATVEPDGDTVTVLDPWLREAAVRSLAGMQRFSDFGAFAPALHAGEPVLVEDTLADPRTASRGAAFEAFGIASFANLALFDRGRMIGLIVATDDRRRAWREDEVAFLRSVADRTWAALQTAEAEARLVALNRGLESQVALRTAERDRVWRNARDLMVVIGRDGVFHAVNPAWTGTLGHDPSEVEGRSLLTFIHPEDAAPTLARLTDATALSRGTDFENRYFHRDGSTRWLSWHSSTEGDLVFGYGRDITAQKQQEAALRAAEEALRQSQKMEAVGQLTGGLAHDFNNLLTGIIGSLEMLQRRVAQGRVAEAARFVTAAQAASRRAAALTHRLLAFSRRQTLDPRPTAIAALTAGMQDLIERAIGPAITLTVIHEPGLWTTLVDPNQLENALLNLCLNARDAMPDGGALSLVTANVVLDAEAAGPRDLPAGDYVRLTVTDTGTGMTQEVMQRAFDPFFTTKPLGEGTGLGLSMIYGFVRQSGGHVGIESAPGHGTSMVVHLPRHDQAPEDAHADKDAQAAAEPAARATSVLVVDDEPTVRMLVIAVLGDLGYDTVDAADGAAGLAILRTSRPVDLMVTDVGLPGGMNGRQLADAGRALRPDLKVLFITGYAEATIIGTTPLEDGMQVLTKPFAVETLAARVSAMVA